MSKRSIENLFIWKQAREVVNLVYLMMKECKDYSFRDQIQRATVSIMNNIAEGFDSGSDARYASFLNISRGSCAEVYSMLYLCEDFKLCTPEERIDIQTLLAQISTGIVNLNLTLSANKQRASS